MSVKSVRSRVLLFCCLVFATALVNSPGQVPAEIGVTIEWDPNPESEIAGYNVYVGTESGAYNRVIDNGLQTSVRVSPLDPGITYYFAVTAYTSDGLESPFSDEISYAVPIDGTNAVFTPLTITVTNAESPVALEFITEPGLRYLVQASIDLIAWQTLEAFTPGTSGTMSWTDMAAPSYDRRFYRVIAQSQGLAEQ